MVRWGDSKVVRWWDRETVRVRGWKSKKREGKIKKNVEKERYKNCYFILKNKIIVCILLHHCTLSLLFCLNHFHTCRVASTVYSWKEQFSLRAGI